jgi:formylglycine-generating enzyme required for sulfatase activity
VGSLHENELDIYDMSGNVDEWCLDWHAPYSVSSQNNPLGPSSGECKVYRGGNWRGDFSLCETIHRNKLKPYGTDPALGLRLALNI